MEYSGGSGLMQFLRARMSFTNDCRVQIKLENPRPRQAHKLAGVYMQVQAVVSLKCSFSYSTLPRLACFQAAVQLYRKPRLAPANPARQANATMRGGASSGTSQAGLEPCSQLLTSPPTRRHQS